MVLSYPGIEYNGGHASNGTSSNVFWMRCKQEWPNSEVPAANCDQPYPATAPQGSGSGPQTISLPCLRQRDRLCCISSRSAQWGGCADLKVSANAAPEER